MTVRRGFLLLTALVAVARFCHLNIVWVEEAYPMAAALEMLRGKMLYRDIWFDKPPLFPAYYALFGAWHGWQLRLAGALLVLACCFCAFLLAREWWTEREGLAAAGLLGFFLTFGIPSAVMAAAPDLLMIAPHLLAIFFCVREQPVRAGLACGVAMLINTKAAYVGAACLAWHWRSAHLLAGGFVVAQAPALLWLWSGGALGAYWQQVWQWGFLYSTDSPYASPLAEGLRRTLNWVGFHATLAAGTVLYFLRREGARVRPAIWLLLSVAAVAAGWRFFPRYYFQLLAPMVVLAAWGLCAMRGRCRLAVLALLLIPLIRFGPRYIQVATGQPWGDLALHDDSRDVAAFLRARGARSLLVWGYRPDVYAHSRIPAGTRFLDSQPLTGVIADRHLVDSRPTAPELAKQNRLSLFQTNPDAIVDGLGPLNPALAISSFDDLRPWLAHYEVIHRTPRSTVYLRRPESR
ncbi:MAG: hypothetical protein JNL98_20430 [Bryobacterales bacterium]|nr:hypothetical protein [Bryobacterales bacterium]